MIVEIIPFVAMVFTIYATTFYNYLLFHTLAEMFAIITLGGIFIIGWNTRAYARNNFYLVIGVSSVFVAIIELLHTLAYSGMPLFTKYNLEAGMPPTNLPTQLWIAGRYFQAVAILAALLLINVHLRPRLLIVSFALGCAVLLVGIFWQLFPVAHNGTALTPFKVYSEYIIDGILGVSAFLLYKNRALFSKKILILTFLFLLSLMISELWFTQYVGVYDLSNLIGHLFMILGYTFAYKAIIQTNLARPLESLFKQLRESRDELDMRVHERTAELERMNTVLKDNRDILAKAQAVGRIGNWNWNFKSGQVTWSDEMYHIFGLKPGEFNGDVEAITTRGIHPADQERVRKVNQRVFSEHVYTPAEYRIIRPDGSERWARSEGEVQYDSAGNTTGAFGIVQDITERKMSELRIREQAELLDNARDAIMVFGINNRIKYWNKGAERLYGWKTLEAIDKEPSDLFFKGDDSISVNAMNIANEKGEWNGEMEYEDRTGKRLVVDCRWTLLRDGGGNPESILAINTDITEKKKFESQFLRNQRIESIGNLAAGIAHDFNNILTPIMLSMDFFNTSLKDKDSQRMLEMVKSNVKRAADMAKQILSFARGAEGERQPVQITRLVTEAMRTIKEAFPKSIEIRTHVPADLGSITGDLTQLHQVLMNLCLNARDAMPHGGTLDISAESLFIDDDYARLNVGARTGQHVVITVSDTGTGMPPSVMDRIFEPYFTTKKQGEGTGLGLATALGIVKSHGGFIHVYSEVGKGSTFKVYLPSSSTTGESTAKPPELKDFQGHGEQILVVDDEETIRTIATSSIEGNGYKVLAASDGAEAVGLYAMHANEIKVVLLDMMMPVMDGYACIKALRKIKSTVKIIGVSGLKQNEAHPDIAANANAFLQKPFTTEKLLETIREVLSS